MHQRLWASNPSNPMSVGIQRLWASVALLLHLWCRLPPASSWCFLFGEKTVLSNLTTKFLLASAWRTQCQCCTEPPLIMGRHRGIKPPRLLILGNLLCIKLCTATCIHNYSCSTFTIPDAADAHVSDLSISCLPHTSNFRCSAFLNLGCQLPCSWWHRCSRSSMACSLSYRQ